VAGVQYFFAGVEDGVLVFWCHWGMSLRVSSCIGEMKVLYISCGGDGFGGGRGTVCDCPAFLLSRGVCAAAWLLLIWVNGH